MYFMQVCRAQMVGGSSKSATLQDGQSPQDMLKVFAETQKNMMELNRYTGCSEKSASFSRNLQGTVIWDADAGLHTIIP